MKRTILVSLTVAAVVALVVAGSTWFARVRSLPTAGLGRTQAQTTAPAAAPGDPKGVFADKPVTECRAVELPPLPQPPPPSDQISTSLDIYSRRLQISYYDPQLQANRRIYINVDDPTCGENPRLKLLIDHVLKLDAEFIVDSCRSFAEVVREGRSEVNGEKVNLEAAKRFLQRWCK